MGRCRTGLVLSGGGARGAYEVGVVQGIVEVLGRPVSEPGPFQVFTGTSVGAINAAFLASRAHRADVDIGKLVALWSSLSLDTHVQVVLRPWRTRSMLDADPIATLLRDHVDWSHLRDNVDAGRVCALVIPSLHVATGRTVMFTDLAPGVNFHPSRDPGRVTIPASITAEHVLASSAIPGVFPPVRIGGSLFYDGGLRFNTPIAPAIRAGARRLVVISPLFSDRSQLSRCTTLEDIAADDPGTAAPDVRFLLGKLLAALMLDPVVHDLSVLERFNVMVRLLTETLTEEERVQFAAATTVLRGQPYREVPTLALTPSADIGAMGVRYLQTHAKRMRQAGAAGWLIRSLAGDEESPSDLASYLLFDGPWAEELIALGRRDALDRGAEIRDFFAG